MNSLYLGITLLVGLALLVLVVNRLIRSCWACNWQGVRLTQPDRCPRCQNPL